MNSVLEKKHIDLKRHGCASDLVLGLVRRGSALCLRTAVSEWGQQYKGGSPYRFEFRAINDKRYYRVFPTEGMIYELVTPEQFALYFRELL